MTALSMLRVHHALVAATLFFLLLAVLVIRSLDNSHPSGGLESGTAIASLISQTIRFQPADSNFDWNRNNHSADGILFIKTHKTSSSTLSRLIYRVSCEVQGKKCFLPNKENPGKIWDLRKRSDYKYVARGAPYEVWVSHVMVTRLLLGLMHPGSFLVSVCRHPALRFRSAWTWYGHEERFGVSLSAYIAHLNTSLGIASKRSNKLEAGRGNRKVPPQPAYLYRTGLDSVHEEITGIEDGRLSASPEGGVLGPFLPFAQLIESMRSSRCFILVSDRLDESLLVLGVFMRWDLPDLVYASQKVTSPPLAALSESEMRVLEAAQPLDSALYKAANTMLDYYIQQYPGGEGAFRTHLKSLRRRLSAVHALCRIGDKPLEGAAVSASGNGLSYAWGAGNISSSWDFSYLKGGNGGDITVDLATNSGDDIRSYCDSIRRDNNEAVRFEWARRRHGGASLKRLNMTFTPT